MSDDIPNNIDLLLIDGPNGNGRSLAFLMVVKKMRIGSWIMIDDANHYDFYQRCNEIFETQIINQSHEPKIHINNSYIFMRVVGFK